MVNSNGSLDKVLAHGSLSLGGDKNNVVRLQGIDDLINGLNRHFNILLGLLYGSSGFRRALEGIHECNLSENAIVRRYASLYERRFDVPIDSMSLGRPAF